MAKRKIVKIDEEKCTGCGLCIPNCAEGALQIINGKARLVSDKFCDGLGACLGHCPEDAITIIEREAEEFDEKAVELHLHIKNEPKAESPYCPSSKPIQFKVQDQSIKLTHDQSSVSLLSNWPVQLKLVPTKAPYLNDADLLICADCVPFSYPNFHEAFLKGRIVVVGCPKLDNIQFYRDKLIEILKENPIKSLTITYMEVPCCFGIVRTTEDAIIESGREITLRKVKIGIRGEIKQDEKNSKYFQTIS